MKRSGILAVISGPSGAGKGSVLKELNSLEGVAISISATTRKPRESEKDGVDYFFISRFEFEKYIEKDDMIEYNEYCGNLYGTIKSKLDRLLEENDVVILEIDVNGASLVLNRFRCVRIFLLPPSFEELERRLLNRGTETKESLKKRLEEASREIKRAYEYDYLVINDNIKKAAKDIKKIAELEFLRVERNKDKIESFFR